MVILPARITDYAAGKGDGGIPAGTATAGALGAGGTKGAGAGTPLGTAAGAAGAAATAPALGAAYGAATGAAGPGTATGVAAGVGPAGAPGVAAAGFLVRWRGLGIGRWFAMSRLWIGLPLKFRAAAMVP